MYGYGYEGFDYEWGDIKVFLDSTKRKFNRDHIYGVPYSIKATVRLYDLPKGTTFKVTNFRLLDNTGKTIMLSSTEKSEAFKIKKTYKEYSNELKTMSGLVIININTLNALKYIDYNFQCDFEITGESINVKESIKGVFKRAYSEYETDTLEKILSAG